MIFYEYFYKIAYDSFYLIFYRNLYNIFYGNDYNIYKIFCEFVHIFSFFDIGTFNKLFLCGRPSPPVAMQSTANLLQINQQPRHQCTLISMNFYLSPLEQNTGCELIEISETINYANCFPWWLTVTEEEPLFIHSSVPDH